jgi:hypothetical protein
MPLAREIVRRLSLAQIQSTLKDIPPMSRSEIIRGASFSALKRESLQ